MTVRDIDNRYTTIERLALSQGERDLADACDQTGQSEIDAELVQQKLLDIIYMASRTVDGYLLKHMTIPIPETITALTVGTSITMTNGSHAVVGVGTLFLTELTEGDEIYLVDDENYWFGVVDSITDDLNLVLKYQYNGLTVIATIANKRQIVVPGWVELHARNYALYEVWRLRGRKDEDNPWAEDRENSRLALVDFQRSKQKFLDGTTVRKNNPVQGEKEYSDRVMTQTSLGDYTSPPY